MVACQKIQLTPVNGRTVRLTGDYSICTVTHNEDDVTEIVSVMFDFDDGPCIIHIGDTITVGEKSRFKVNIIREFKDPNGTISHFDLMTAALNTSSIMALPLLGGTRELFMWDKLFVNAFVETESFDTGIALLYRYSSLPIFTKFESALCSFRTFVRRTDPDTAHVLFEFNVPDKAKESYNNLKLGLYSQIDDEFKLKILQFHHYHIDGHTGQVLFQAPSLRARMEEQLQVVIPEGAELYDKLDMNKERYTIEYYSPKKKIL
tara:strand:+ start:460 stop:1245 length:786 start_codon:yes stop_codon:yes gene_type:complete